MRVKYRKMVSGHNPEVLSVLLRDPDESLLNHQRKNKRTFVFFDDSTNINQFGQGGTNAPIFRIALKNYFTSIASD